MRRNTHSAGFLALVLAVAFCQFTPGLRAQNQTQDPNPPQQQGYYLDDQERAKQYDGQNVKVTGTLDVATSTIHVTDIQPA